MSRQNQTGWEGSISLARFRSLLRAIHDPRIMPLAAKVKESNPLTSLWLNHCATADQRPKGWLLSTAGGWIWLSSRNASGGSAPPTMAPTPTCGTGALPQ